MRKYISTVFFAIILVAFATQTSAQSPLNAVPAPAPAAPQAQAQQPQPAAVPETPKPAWMGYNNPYTQSAGLDVPNITEAEIVNWTQNTVSEIFAIPSDKYTEKLQEIKNSFFAKTGWKNYATFMKQSGTLEDITTKGYSISAIVRNPPVITNEKAIDGFYHWVLKMDVSISFFVLTERGEIRTVKTGNYLIMTDIQRIKEEGRNDLNLAINDIKIEPDLSGGGY